MATPKQIRRRGRVGLVFGAIVAALTLGVVIAYADDISNNLDTSIDAVAEVMPLNQGGVAGSTQLYVQPRNEDGKQGCNLTGSTTLVVSVSSSDTSVATVSPSTVTFASCGATPTLTVTPHAAGSATISLAQTSNDTGGTFNLAPATFTVNVAPPSNTAPVVSVSGVAAGASYDKGSVPSATCEVTDAEDGNSSSPATLSVVTGQYASDGIGSQTASCSYTDGGGLTATDSVTYSIVDPTAPEIHYSVAGTLGDNGWYTSDVTLTWTVTENESPSSLVETGCVDQNITADQAETVYSCLASSAGGSSGPESVGIKRDATPPAISGATDPALPDGLAGWYISAPTVNFTCVDATSDVASCVVDGTSSDHMTLGESVSPQAVGGTATDNAGNTSTASVTSLKVDLSDPTVASWSGSINDGDSFYFGFVPAAPTCTAADAISGPASCVVTGYSTAVGSHTLTATATDNAGRTGTDTRTYTVLAWTLNGFYQPVDMSGSTTIWNTVKGGSTVPLKFNIYAGTTKLTDTSYVQSLKYKGVSCSSTPSDAIETTATGGTSLRYDTTGGQFVYNWQTPKTPGACLQVTMTTLDGSSLSAYFKLK